MTQRSGVYFPGGALSHAVSHMLSLSYSLSIFASVLFIDNQVIPMQYWCDTASVPRRALFPKHKRFRCCRLFLCFPFRLLLATSLPLPSLPCASAPLLASLHCQRSSLRSTPFLSSSCLPAAFNFRNESFPSLPLTACSSLASQYCHCGYGVAGTRKVSHVAFFSAFLLQFRFSITCRTGRLRVSG